MGRSEPAKGLKNQKQWIPNRRRDQFRENTGSSGLQGSGVWMVIALTRLLTMAGFDGVRLARPAARLLEQLLRRHRQAIGDVGRAIGNFEHMMAERAAKLAFASGSRGKLDAAEAGMALRTNNVVSFHGVILCRTTMTVRRRRLASGAKVEDRIDGADVLRVSRRQRRGRSSARDRIFDSTTNACCVILLTAPGQGAFCIPQQF